MLEDIKQINPRYWGKQSWIFLNSLGLVYSEEKKQDYELFFSKLGNLLPCEICSSHYNLFLPKLTNALENKTTFVNWLLEIRNDINIKSNKPVLSMSDIINEIFFSQVGLDKKFTKSVETNTEINNKNIFFKKNLRKKYFVIFILLITILICKIKKKIKKNKKQIKKNKNQY